MTDRIADIRGTRTPHGRDEAWPVRVDLHLDRGLAESDVDRWVQSACVLCSNGCGCDIAVEDGRMVGGRGRAQDAVDHGRLVPRGAGRGRAGGARGAPAAVDVIRSGGPAATEGRVGGYPLRMSERPEVAPGTLAVCTDIVCAWSTITLHRLHRARAEAGLDDELAFDLRLFPLEEVNGFPLPERFLAAEIPVVGQLEQELGWQVWQGDPSAWPKPPHAANEAVHAAKAQSLRAAEELDTALRRALFRDSRPIALRHEILDVAEGCSGVDVDALAEALDDGRARGPMLADSRRYRDAVQGSPHLFLADGSDVHHPDVDFRWAGGGEGRGFPVVTRDEPQTCAEIVRRAAG